MTELLKFANFLYKAKYVTVTPAKLVDIYEHRYEKGIRD